MGMLTRLLLAGLVLPVLASCGTQDSPSSGGAEPAGRGGSPGTVAEGPFELPVPGEVDRPDEVRLHVITEAGQQVDLAWWTACLSFPGSAEEGVAAGSCADGTPPDDPPRVGSPTEVPLAIDLPGWRFTRAMFRPHGGGDMTVQGGPTSRIERTGERTFVVPAPDEPGDYDVDVFGRGPEGDAVTTFRWVVR